MIFGDKATKRNLHWNAIYNKERIWFWVRCNLKPFDLWIFHHIRVRYLFSSLIILAAPPPFKGGGEYVGMTGGGIGEERFFFFLFSALDLVNTSRPRRFKLWNWDLAGVIQMFRTQNQPIVNSIDLHKGLLERVIDFSLWTKYLHYYSLEKVKSW